MPLGGSITQGVGSSTGHGYRAELVKLLTDNNYDVEMMGTRSTGTGGTENTGNENDDCRHEGWRGFRIDQIDKKARRCVEQAQPDVFTVNAGSNDCLQDYELDRVGERMGRLVEYLWTASPGSTVVLSTLVVSRDPKVDTRIVSVNRAFRELVEKKYADQKRIVLADMYTPEGPSIDDLGDDGTHPQDAGYTKMAGIWCRAIDEAARKGFLR
ncbi:hypothetical protein Sste5346_004797 [Sporothrix stenoceras]|uniref:SGNH hydrolase-type esterase domain-containing protein n=1 Tax=Sporothrix stenoceras TaxID=5173 RepID=A0ABR3Z683_9PEZI